MGEEFKTQRTTKVAACEFPANDGANRTGELNCVNVSLALVYVRRCLLVFCKAKIALLCFFGNSAAIHAFFRCFLNKSHFVEFGRSMASLASSSVRV